MANGLVFNKTSAAFNVERVRAELLSRVSIPDDLLQAAIDSVRKKLNAKETKFFTYQGQVVERVDVEDHATQLSAADKVLSIAGLYARERDQRPATPQVAIEVDPVSGVVRMIIGGADTLPISIADASMANVVDARPGEIAIDAISESEGDHLLQQPSDSIIASGDGEPEVIRVKRGSLPIDVHNALFGDA